MYKIKLYITEDGYFRGECWEVSERVEWNGKFFVLKDEVDEEGDYCYELAQDEQIKNTIAKQPSAPTAKRIQQHKVRQAKEEQTTTLKRPTGVLPRPKGSPNKAESGGDRIDRLAKASRKGKYTD